MRKTLAGVLVLTAGLAISQGAAQRRELTVIAGGTFSGASGDNLDKQEIRPGFTAGISLRIPRTSRFSLETQLLVTQRHLFGQRPPSSSIPQVTGPFAEDANLLFVEAPILIRFQQGYSTARLFRPFFQLGGYVGVRLQCSRELTASNGTKRRTDCSLPTTFTAGNETYIPAVYQDLDLGLAAGVGVEIRQVAVGVRFTRSIRNLVEPAGGVRTSPFDGSRLWGLVVSAEYLIRVL